MTLRTPLGTYSSIWGGGAGHELLRHDVPFFDVRKPLHSFPACVGELVQVQLRDGRWINLHPGELHFREGMARERVDV